MKTDVWKISINLRRKGTQVVSVAGRGPTGCTIRTAGIANSSEDLQKFIAGAFDSFDKFSEEEADNSKKLAYLQSVAQRAEQERKG